MDIFETPEKRTLKLADGKEYELPLLNLNTLADVEKILGFGLNKLSVKLEESPATTLRMTIYALLKQKNPELTLDQTGDLVTIEVMKNAADVITKLISV